ncbi:hypothetical protein [Candidatus Enterococcus lemimoniae]|uniref:hypothetical protein n=1 Tax=Candidatus Enterococcus lemimoniae TaxID=1834167 RepID=UPI0011208E59|nr:hypothetical protein [Enterococcus sp. 12C11_DIV0727]
MKKMLFKATDGVCGKELEAKRRVSVLHVVCINLEVMHGIKHSLTVFKIPRTTYYEYLNWTPNNRIFR